MSHQKGGVPRIPGPAWAGEAAGGGRRGVHRLPLRVNPGGCSWPRGALGQTHGRQSLSSMGEVGHRPTTQFRLLSPGHPFSFFNNPIIITLNRTQHPQSGWSVRRPGPRAQPLSPPPPQIITTTTLVKNFPQMVTAVDFCHTPTPSPPLSLSAHSRLG